jgi:uncharacterized protein (TIGR02246 family)
MSFTGPIEDRLAIRELLERYADAVNRTDHEAWGDTWAEDGAWSLPGITESDIKGREAIVATWREAMKRFPQILFIATPGAIEIDGDRATVRSYTYETFPMDGKINRNCGRYDDEVVRTADGWKFARRSFQTTQRT